MSRSAAILKRCPCGSIFPASIPPAAAWFDCASSRLLEDKDPTDNQREVDVDIVDRKNRVLLFAGGPTREYQFVRNMLRRSELAKSGDMIVDVLLQSADEGVSQDANEILTEFPHTMQDLAQYDTIIAFDPDWRELDPQQIELVEKWVGEESGGLIAIAGPIYTDAWVQTPAMATIRKLYPVEFNRRLALLEDAHYGSQQPWPLDFTREGLEAEFLWLDDNAATSREVWDSFQGVFGYYRVRGPKLGATTYAIIPIRKRPPAIRSRFTLPGQFYGSGRVFYMGSGEMWRLRELDERYFNSFYTKLIRHVSQGRLLRGSPLGQLAGRTRSIRGRQHRGRASAAHESAASAARRSQSHAASNAAGRRAHVGHACRRSGAQGNVFRAIHRHAGRGMPVGFVASRFARSAPHAAAASVHAEAGARKAGTQ